MNPKVSFEKFRPRLRRGQISPQGNKLVYETAKPFEQIFLPIELTDFLIYCDGRLTIREIIEIIYKKKKTIHFKLIYKTVYYLKSKNLFENSDELVEKGVSPEQKTERITFFKLKPLFSVYIGKRISNDVTYPNIFYGLSLIVLITSLLCLKDIKILSLPNNFLTPETGGSYFSTAIFLFLFLSLMLSAKSIFKCLLLVFLTGRAYNFRIIFNGFAFYFKVASDSLFLITNKLYLLLFHLSIAFSHFFFIFIAYLFFPQLPNYDLMLWLAFLLLLVDLNPFQESELNHLFKSVFQDESVFRLSNYYNSSSLLNTFSSLGYKSYTKTIRYFLGSTYLWSFATIFSVSLILFKNYYSLESAIKYANILEKLSALVILSSLLTILLLVTVNLIKLTAKYIVEPIYLKFKKTKDVSKTRISKESYTRDKIIEILADLPLFNYFSNELLNMIIDKGDVVELPAEHKVIRQGDIGNELFVLLEGEVKIIKNLIDGQSKEITSLRPYSIFGEIAAIEECQRTADVTTSEDSKVLSIPAKIIRHAAEESEYIREIHAFRNIIMVNQFFSSAPLFSELPEDVIQLFLMKGKIEHYSNNQVVFRQGTQGDGFYLVIRGQVKVVINGKEVSQIKQGGFFGEISVIADMPRTATIRVDEPTMLLKIGADAFWDILSSNIEMAMFIESVGEMRIKEDIEFLNESL